MFGFGKNKKSEIEEVEEMLETNGLGQVRPQSTPTQSVPTQSMPTQSVQPQTTQSWTQQQSVPTQTVQPQPTSTVAQPQMVQRDVTSQVAQEPQAETVVEEPVVEEPVIESKKQNNGEKNLVKSAFTTYLPIALAIIALGLHLLYGFMILVDAYNIAEIFQFFAYGTSIAAVIVEAVRQIKSKQFEFNASLIVVLLTLFIIG